MNAGIESLAQELFRRMGLPQQRMRSFQMETDASGNATTIKASFDPAPQRTAETEDELVAAVCKAVAKDIASNTGPIWAALREQRRDDPKAGG